MLRSRLTRFMLWPLFGMLLHASANAATLTVGSGQGEYNSIQKAIDAATNEGDIISIPPGTYTDTIALRKDITLQGQELARVILKGDSDDTVITADGDTNVTLKNLTIIGAEVGLSISNESEVTVEHCVFNMGSKNTAIVVDAGSSLEIENNTFYQNNIAIDSKSDDITANYNVFDTGTKSAFSFSEEDVTPKGCTKNYFISGISPGFDATNDCEIEKPTTSSAFVSTSKYDFHPKSSGSALVSDKQVLTGSYHGSNADGRPYPISNIEAEVTSSDPTASPVEVAISWDKNESYLMAADTAGYKIYYHNGNALEKDSDSGEFPLESYGEAKKTVAASEDNASLTGLTPVAETISGEIESIETTFASEQITASWNETSDATGYRISWMKVGDEASKKTEYVEDTSYTIKGLTNLQTYEIIVTPFRQDRFYFVVAAYSGSESTLSAITEEISLDLGEREYGDDKTVTEMPEEIVGHPNLPDEGCFIATAAYGYYSEAHVQVLRDFRDQYLLTHELGRGFVEWYYQKGPVAAHALNQNPNWKPWVQAALAPVVATSAVLLGTSDLEKSLMIASLAILLLVMRKRKKGIRLVRLSA